MTPTTGSLGGLLSRTTASRSAVATTAASASAGASATAGAAGGAGSATRDGHLGQLSNGLSGLFEFLL